MQSRIILTFIATIGTSSSLAHATSTIICPLEISGQSDTTCPGNKIAWRGNDGNCCPSVEDIDCATYVPFEYYKAQKNSDGSSQCWIANIY